MATERYTERIGVRATTEEARIIEERADQAGLSKSRYLAQVGTQAESRFGAAGAEEAEALHYQLKRGADRLVDVLEEVRDGASIKRVEATLEQLEEAARKALEAL